MRSTNFLSTVITLVAFLFLPTAATKTAGCGKTPTIKSGAINNMTVNSKSRQYIVTLPSNYDSNTPYRLIFGLHWLTGTFTDVANGGIINPYYGIPPLANNTAIFVAPDGLNKGWANSGGEDITFITQIMKKLDDELCINENLRFSMGFSYGAGMSYSIACTLSKDFRAVAALSGALLSGCIGGTDSVAYYAQHGVSDQVLNISQGRTLRDNFVKNNGCKSTSPPEPSAGSKTHIQTKYEGCKDGKPVWWTAFDGDHTPIPADSGANKDTTWTSNEVWKFFSQFE